jgi:hypothetical protein
MMKSRGGVLSVAREERGVRMTTTLKDPPRISDLQTIPGVGPSIAQDLFDLGFPTVRDLAGQDPEQLYRDLCLLRGGHVDRCVLYVFRCATYYASHQRHDPELLKWWNWQERGKTV